MVLLNAAYLKASWESPFPKERTADGSFRVTPQSAVTVPMMHKARVLRYVAASNFQAVELPYVGEDLNMLIVLPAEGQLQAVRNSMDDAWFRDLAFVQGPVDLSLPKFRISWGPEEFKETLADLTRMVLLNAAYLKASWERPFSKEDTRDGSFRLTPQSAVTVPMMHQVTGAMRYAAGSNFQAVELPYLGGDLKMLIVLPAEGELQAVRNSMDDAWFRTVAFADTAVSLSLPKFRISWGPEEFKETLAAMGMPRAFDEKQGDFSHITTDEQLKITHVLQKAFVGIDEFGTEAAAVSTVIGGGFGPVEEVTVDHPFLFAIVDKTGAVVFAGQVMDPR